MNTGVFYEVPAECQLDMAGSRRRAADLDIWTNQSIATVREVLEYEVNMSYTPFPYECAHRRRDTRRRNDLNVVAATVNQEAGLLPKAGMLPLVSGTTLLEAGENVSSSTYQWTLAFYQEASNGRIYDIGQVAFDHRTQLAANKIVRRQDQSGATNFFRISSSWASTHSAYDTILCWSGNTADNNGLTYGIATYNNIADALNDMPGNIVGEGYKSPKCPSDSGARLAPDQTVSFWLLENFELLRTDGNDRKPQEPTRTGMMAWFQSEYASSTWYSSISYHAAVPTEDSAGLVNHGNTTLVEDLFNGGMWYGLTNSTLGTSWPLRYISGPKSSAYYFGSLLPPIATICAITRYTGLHKGSILIGTDENVVIGHWRGYGGVAYFEDLWLTQLPASGKGSEYFYPICVTHEDSTVLASNEDVSKLLTHRAQGLAINRGGCCYTVESELSDWSVAEVIIWDRALTDDELQQAYDYLVWKLETGSNQSILAGSRPKDPPIPMLPQDGLEAAFHSSALPSSGSLSQWVSDHGTYLATVNGSVTTGIEGRYGASGLRFATGDVSTSIDFGPVLKQTFTICSLTRYSGRQNQGTILTSSTGDVIHGHWRGRVGVAKYHEVWRTDNEYRNLNSMEWLAMCGSNGGEAVLDGTLDVSINLHDTRNWYYKDLSLLESPHPGEYCYAEDLGHAASQNTTQDFCFWLREQNSHLTINPAQSRETKSDYAVAEVIIWNRTLSDQEMQDAASYLLMMLRKGTT